jgi:gamma-glutamyltranspeptidase/glutathione hydrolase
VLRRGGNAVDAAVATAFALAVTYPEAGSLGGGGFLVVRRESGEAAALDFREKAPLGARRDMFLDASGRVTEDAVTGHLAAGVPGAVAGLHAAWRRFGSLPWEDLLAPAIGLAADGFTVDERMSRTLAERRTRLLRFPSTVEVFFPGGHPPRVGSTFRQPALAETLRLIARQGPDAFYRGRIADLIVQEMQRGRGLITHEDLALYEAKWRDPIAIEYRDHTIWAPPPPSSGGVTLAGILNILEGYDLEGYGWQSPESIHLHAEAFRRAYADRNYYLGDPDFVEMPIARLTSDAYAAELRTTISMNRASSSEDFNRVPRVREGTHTTHLSVVDAGGNAVSLTTTINSLYGNGVVVAGAGFFLNNVMDDFSARPGAPNQFGLIQGEANAIEPGKRMLSAMTPIIVGDPDGRLLLVAGSRGGSTIITQMAQIVTNLIDYGMSLRNAVDAPRMHHQHFPDEISYERGGLDPFTAQALQGMGHRLNPSDGYFGEVQAILRRSDGTLVGVADERMVGEAVGY